MAKKMVTSALAVGFIFSSIVLQDEGVGHAYADGQAPTILITELNPNTTNVGKSDGYEFIELYNNTEKEISLKDYKLLYRYPNSSSPDVEWGFNEDKKIPAHGTVVVWVKNSENKSMTLDQFNAFYKTDLTADQVIEIETVGMSNTAERTLVVTDAFKNEIVSARYVKEDVKEDVGIQYKWSSESQTMTILKNDVGATPGQVIEGQIPDTQGETIVDSKPPQIKHTPMSKANAEEGFKILANVSDNINVKNVQLSYRLDNQAEWTDIPMTLSTDNNYEVILTTAQLTGNELSYKITAYDGANTVTTDEYKTEITHPDYNPQDVPYLLVTELVPDSTNVGSSDGYEYVEVYNNSDKTLNMKDYKLHYRYPDEGPAGDLIWGPENEDIELASGETLVYWIINGANQDKTVDDFNKNYGTNLVENKNIVKIYNSGMANGSPRGISISTNTSEDISVAYYNDNGTNQDTAKDKGIFYTFPKTLGDKVMKKYSSKTDLGTPGTVSSIQVPTEKVKLADDKEAPIISDKSNTEAVTDQTDVQLNFDIKDNQLVKTARLYYKNDQEPTYHVVDLKKDSTDGLYKYTVYAANLIGKKSLQYYVEASDGTNVEKTTAQKIDIIQDKRSDGLSLNVENNSLLSQNVLLKAYHSQDNSGTKLTLDDQEITNDATYTLPDKAYFAVDVKKTNLFFKNGITIGDDVLRIFDDTINEYTTLTVPVDPKYFEKGKGTTISIRSGNKVSPLDQTSTENRDDFYVKNIRLILSDGTIINDPKFNNPTKEIPIGDSAGMSPTIDANFMIPEEKYTTKTYAWDTKTATDGKHIFKAVNGTDSVQAKVLVDNSAPIITPSVEEGNEYKGDFSLQAEAEDKYSGVQEVKATLDGKDITLPMHTSSAELSPGTHTFTVTATDQLGNTAIKSTNFKVVEEQPYEPELITPKDKDKEVNLSPELKVKVSDPTNDQLDVSFNRGYQYKADLKSNLTVYENNVDREPPTAVISQGEKVVTDVDKLTKADGQYITTKDKEKFPYHRFEIKLDPNIDASDEIEVNWEGKSIIGRKVSMYIWNYDTSKWEVKEWKIAENSDNFKLHASLKGKEYIKDHKVQVMIQDEIASTNQFDYSLIWMSDTQYYSESYPYIYDKMTNWIANQKEAMNIKYVFHTGDLVDKSYQEYEWENADKSMEILDQASVPYGVLAGNHDVNHKDEDYTKYGQYFGESRFMGKDYYGGSYKNNRGHYDLISEKGNDFIMLYMGWGVNEEDMKWLNEVLAKYPERKAILNFHEYLLVSGNRSPIGEEIYKKVVVPNKNVIAVLSGHYHDAETLVDQIDDNNDGTPDRKVYQMLADYQGGPEGGQGFMRLLEVNPVENKIYMKTYSPYLDKFNFYDTTEYPSKDEFVIDTDLTPKEKEVSTDAFEVNVFTDDEIGKVRNIKNNETATVKWKSLEKNTVYKWFVDVTDRFKGKTRSPIWSFTTTATEQSGGNNNGNIGGGNSNNSNGNDNSGNHGNGGTIEIPGKENESHSITIKDNEGKILATQTIKGGSTLKAPKKVGYTFLGWYADRDYKKVFDFETMLTEDKTTIYAKYVKNPLNVNGFQKKTTAYNKVELNWQKGSDATGYEIYRSTSKNGKYAKLATIAKGSNTKYTDSKVISGETYYYKICTYKKIENQMFYSAYSQVIAATTALNKPTKLSIKNGANSITIKFQRSSGASGYEIYRADNKTKKFKKVTTLSKWTTTQYKDKAIKKGQKYTYKIRAYRNINNKKIYSDWVVK